MQNENELVLRKTIRISEVCTTENLRLFSAA